jgi:hypothetical protein
MIQTPCLTQPGLSQPVGSPAVLGSPQMSAAKPRTGLCSFGDLVNRLVQLYETQNELEQDSPPFRSTRRAKRNLEPNSSASMLVPAQQQTTFGFYECEV